MSTKHTPILFSGPMVRALLDGSKTQTRRVVKAKHLPWVENSLMNFLDGKWNQRPLPYGQPGDRLWVRETWGLHAYGDDTDWLKGGCTALDLEDSVIAYRADWGPMQDSCHWRPSIHMPRAASRITLEVTGARVERLEDISEADAKAEGAPDYEEGIDAPQPDGDHEWSYRASFRRLWESINGPESWNANPWVWVLEFKRVKGGAA